MKSEGLHLFWHKPNIYLDPEIAKSLCAILSSLCKHYFNIFYVLLTVHFSNI